MLSSIGCAEVSGTITGSLCGVPVQSSHMPVAETQPVLLVSESKPSTEDTHAHRGAETAPASVYRALGCKAARPCEAAMLKQYASSDCWMTVQRHEGVGRKKGNDQEQRSAPQQIFTEAALSGQPGSTQQQ